MAGRGKADPRVVMASGILFDPASLPWGLPGGSHRKEAYSASSGCRRLKRIVNDPWRPVQIIFAGKAHQDDQQSKQLLQDVFNVAKDQAFGGRIAFVEDYDELLAQYLVHGVDVWVNNPLPPMEA